MNLIVERPGSLAGIIQRGEKNLAALLPEPQAALQRLLEAGAPPDAAGAGTGQFTFRIKVHDEAGIRSLTVPGALMPAMPCRYRGGIVTGRPGTANRWNTFWKPSIGAIAENLENGPQQYIKIEAQRPMPDIPKIKRHALGHERDRIGFSPPSIHLRPSG